MASISLKLLILGQSLTYVPFSMADSDAGSEEIETLQQQANFDINDQLNAIASDLAELQMVDRVSNFNEVNDVDKAFLDNNLSDIEDVILASESAEQSVDAILSSVIADVESSVEADLNELEQISAQLDVDTELFESDIDTFEDNLMEGEGIIDSEFDEASVDQDLSITMDELPDIDQEDLIDAVESIDEMDESIDNVESLDEIEPIEEVDSVGEIEVEDEIEGMTN